jgi:hypothetical protein
MVPDDANWMTKHMAGTFSFSPLPFQARISRPQKRNG